MKHPILILGGTGFIGSALVDFLHESGEKILLLSRDHKRNQARFPFAQLASSLAEISPEQPLQAIVNLAGANIADSRWTKARKQLLRDSRLQTTQALVQWLSQRPQKPACLIQGSAIGYYGTENNPVCDESSPPGHDFLGQLAQDWEAAAQPAEALGIRVCYLRTSLVLDSQGGALPKMLPPFWFYVGGHLGDGKQWVSWIHLKDEVRLIYHLIQNSTCQGPFNAATPWALSNRDFSKALGRALNRPCWFPTPAFVLEWILGELSVLILKGQKAKPQKTLESGFQFQYPNLQQTLNDLFPKRPK